MNFVHGVFYTAIFFFFMILYMYIAPGQEHTASLAPGDKVLMSTETSCHFGFWKIHCFTFFSYKNIRDQIWTCRKICQGQPRVIIWANLVVLKHPMMHTKIQGHWLFDSGEEDFFFLGFYRIWPWRPSWSCDQDHLSKLSFPHPIESPYEIWLWLA